MTKKVPAKEQIIIEQLKKGDPSSREKAFRELYRMMYTKVVGWIVNQKGTEEQGITIFNIALMRLEKKVLEEHFVLSSSLSSFLMGIVRLVWLEERRKKLHYVEIDESNEENWKEEKSNQEHLEEAILACIKRLGSDCKKILFYKYWLNLNMKQIAERMGLKGDNAAYSAANKKNRCMKKLVQECKKDEILNS